MTESLDMLVIAAHPDDAELYCGGTIARLAAAGRRVGILDLTRGELGTRGTPQERASEAAEASKILGLAGRWNLELPDGGVFNNDTQRFKLTARIRALRPRVVVSHWPGDRHPDHNQAHELVRDALHLAYVGGLKTEHERHRIAGALWFPGYLPGGDPPPTIVTDISDSFPVKMQAIRCYKSQFAVAPDINQGAAPTLISSPEFLRWIEARARVYGQMIQAEYGEPFLAHGPLSIDDPASLFRP